MNTWGESVRLSIFGESHGAGIGIVIDGLPTGLYLDLTFIQSEMARRAPGTSDLSTARREADHVEILSGLFNGKTCGTPLCGIIRNADASSKDYDSTLMRPGHADYTGWVKYKGFGDFRGGGHFSGRITAPLVFAGAVAKLALAQSGITVGAHILRIGDREDERLDATEVNGDELKVLCRKPFPVIDDIMGDMMQAAILKAKSKGDSIGGIVECAAVGLPAGLGEPFFASVESVIASMMFSIPAVKGVEFGSGFKMAGMTGSAANDAFYTNGTDIRTRTNHNGGINGGITNGMPLIFSVAIKPTPSIAKEQNTVNVAAMENATIGVKGRHDPCVVHRAVPVVEAAAALCLLDLLGRA